MSTPKQLGKLHGPEAMFLRVEVGTAEGGGYSFQLATLMDGTPYVKCDQTGKSFILSWKDVIHLALEAGIAASEAVQPKSCGEGGAR